MPLSVEEMDSMTKIMRAALIQAKDLAKGEEYFKAVSLYSEQMLRCIHHMRALGSSSEVLTSSNFSNVLKNARQQMNSWMIHLSVEEKKQIEQKIALGLKPDAVHQQLSADEIRAAEHVIQQSLGLSDAKTEQIKKQLDKIEMLIECVLQHVSSQPSASSDRQLADLALGLRRRVHAFKQQDFSREAFNIFKGQCQQDFSEHKKAKQPVANKRFFWEKSRFVHNLVSQLNYVFETFFYFVEFLIGFNRTPLMSVFTTVFDMQPQSSAALHQYEDKLSASLAKVLDELDRLYDNGVSHGHVNLLERESLYLQAALSVV